MFKGESCFLTLYMQLKQTKLTNTKVTQRNIATILEKSVIVSSKEKQQWWLIWEW